MTRSFSRSVRCLIGAAFAGALLAGCPRIHYASIDRMPTVTTLTTANAQIVGKNATLARTGNMEYIGYWTTTDTFVQWPLKDLAPGTYTVEMLYSLDPQFPGSTIAVTAAGQTLTKKLEATKDWDDYRPLTLGTIKIDRPGIAFLAIRAARKPAAYVMNLRSVTLTPAGN
jgi:hypothetical protein